MRSLNLLNSYLALVLPYTVLNLPVCTLVLVSFFQSIPKDLENAAMIDGCSRLGALWRVVIPLSAPGVFTAGILAFVNAWDEFLLALSLNASAAALAFKDKASKNSSQALTKARMPAVNTPGALKGMTTRHRAPNREQPSIMAAFSKSLGMLWKKLTNTSVQTGKFSTV